MSRAVSTVVDVSLAVLLVSAAAVALVTIPGHEPEPPDPDAAARTVLASTVTVPYGQADERVVSGRVSTLLAHAAVAADRAERPADRAERPGFVAAVEGGTVEVIEAAAGRIELVATAGSETLRVGPRPPPDAAVAATTHRVDANGTAVAVTVRTWSP